jgi:hypothetical protein
MASSIPTTLWFRRGKMVHWNITINFESHAIVIDVSNISKTDDAKMPTNWAWILYTKTINAKLWGLIWLRNEADATYVLCPNILWLETLMVKPWQLWCPDSEDPRPSGQQRNSPLPRPHTWRKSYWNSQTNYVYFGWPHNVWMLRKRNIRTPHYNMLEDTCLRYWLNSGACLNYLTRNFCARRMQSL